MAASNERLGCLKTEIERGRVERLGGERRGGGKLVCYCRNMNVWMRGGKVKKEQDKQEQQTVADEIKKI